VKHRSGTPAELHHVLTTIPLLFINEPRATPDISLPLDGGLAGRCARPRTPVYRRLKNAQVVRLNPTPGTAYKLPNWIHISFRSSEIGSDQCISKEPKTWSDYPPRLSDDDFPPMFTCLIHPSLLRRVDSRRPGRSSNSRDGMTLDDANDAGIHARVYSVCEGVPVRVVNSAENSATSKRASERLLSRDRTLACASGWCQHGRFWLKSDLPWRRNSFTYW